MPAYMIVHVDSFDDAWTVAYRRDVPAMITAVGGRYLSLSRAPERSEGEVPIPQTLAIVEYPSLEVARNFLASAEYRPYLEARQAGAKTTIYLVDGVPS